MDDIWTGEVLGFTEWLRPVSNPTDVQSIALDLVQLGSEVSWQIFERLGLEIEVGMTEAEVVEDFGSDFLRETMREDRVTLTYLLGSADREYRVSFTLDGESGLVYLTMMSHGPSRAAIREVLR